MVAKKTPAEQLDDQMLELESTPDPVPAPPPEGASLLQDRGRIPITLLKPFLIRRMQFQALISEMFPEIMDEESASEAEESARRLAQESPEERAKMLSLSIAQFEYLTDQAENLRKFARRGDKWDEFLQMGDAEFTEKMTALVEWWGAWSKN